MTVYARYQLQRDGEKQTKNHTQKRHHNAQNSIIILVLFNYNMRTVLLATIINRIPKKNISNTQNPKHNICLEMDYRRLALRRIKQLTF